ncbi:MAG: hypothetical protein JRC60_00350 [Deltaproteobacteria bacterium]|nr:hypothetical protein [Deltaproteobacteria bacterium]
MRISVGLGFVMLMVVFLLAGCAALGDSWRGKTPAIERVQDVAAPGVTQSELISRCGAPVRIRPVTSPEGESWIYREMRTDETQQGKTVETLEYLVVFGPDRTVSRIQGPALRSTRWVEN